MLNKLLKFPYFLNDMKHLCLIKWRSNYLVLKLDKIFEIRRQGSNVETEVLWFLVVSLFVKNSVNVGVGNTKEKRHGTTAPRLNVFSM